MMMMMMMMMLMMIFVFRNSGRMQFTGAIHSNPVGLYNNNKKKKKKKKKSRNIHH